MPYEGRNLEYLGGAKETEKEYMVFRLLLKSHYGLKNNIVFELCIASLTFILLSTILHRVISKAASRCHPFIVYGMSVFLQEE